MQPGLPLILLGHSLGGLVAALAWWRCATPRCEGLVLSSPALDAGLNALQKLLLATLPRYAPNLAVGNGLDPDFLSHDPAVVAAYKADPRCTTASRARLARFIAEAARWCWRARRNGRCPRC